MRPSHGAGHTARRDLCRAVLAGGAAGLFTPAVVRAATAPEAAPWQAFRARFVAGDGRVVDTGNAGISHSEGQGYALLGAERFGDRDTFERVLRWTRQRLGRRADGLHAWRYRPGVAAGHEDLNNATDGDLLIGWALLRAGSRWGEPLYVSQGQAIGRAILSRLVVERAGRLLLLPGARGFDHPDRVVVNPSYYVFPALQAMARAVPDPAWRRLVADGLGLLRQARFGRWGLPADWLEISLHPTPALAPAADWPARFSYDAVRVPLNLAWARLGQEPALRAAAAFWSDPGLPGLPAWTDLRTGELAPYGASSGIAAVARLAQQASGGTAVPPLPDVAEARDYYAAALTMLAHVAALDLAVAGTVASRAAQVMPGARQPREAGRSLPRRALGLHRLA